MKPNVFVIVLISFLVVLISGCINNNFFDDSETKSYAISMTQNHGVNKTIEDFVTEKGYADKEVSNGAIVKELAPVSLTINWEAYKIDNDNYKVICEYGLDDLNQEEPTKYNNHTAEFQTNIKTGDIIGLNDLGKQIVSEADNK